MWRVHLVYDHPYLQQSCQAPLDFELGEHLPIKQKVTEIYYYYSKRTDVLSGRFLFVE